MNAVWRAVPDSLLEERRRLGQDKTDEVWDGVLHMPPTPDAFHHRRATHLASALIPIGKRRGLDVYGDANGLYHPVEMFENFRVPDVTMARRDQLRGRWLVEAELVVEMLSPHDEARDKLGFYFDRGVREIWLIEPHPLSIEIRTRAATGFTALAPASVVRSPLLDITVEIDGDVLRLRDGDYLAEV